MIKLSKKLNMSASTLDVVERTISVSDTDNGEIVVSFYTSRKRGSKPTIIPISDYDKFVETLVFYADIETIQSDSEKSISDLIHKSISLDDGMVSFATSPGCANCSSIAKKEFSSVVSFLVSLKDSVHTTADQVRQALKTNKGDDAS